MVGRLELGEEEMKIGILPIADLTARIAYAIENGDHISIESVDREEGEKIWNSNVGSGWASNGMELSEIRVREDGRIVLIEDGSPFSCDGENYSAPRWYARAHVLSSAAFVEFATYDPMGDGGCHVVSRYRAR